LTAGQTLIRLRRYDLAADLMAEGAKAAPQPAAVLSFVDGLRKTRKVEEIAFVGDKPADAVGRLMQVLAADVDVPAAIKPLLSERWLREEVKEEDLAPFSTALRAATAGANLPMDVAMDIGVGLVKFTAEGSDAAGWQVRIQAPGSEAQTAFVIREGGAYRILSMGGDYSGIGWLVLELAAQDKLAEARGWLDRVREEVVPAGGDDPLAGRDFPRLWSRGSDAGKETIRAAAAALLAEDKSSAVEAIPILRKYRNGLPNGAECNVVDSMIASAFSIAYKDADFLETIRTLSANVTGSISTAALYVWALERTGGWKEFDEVAVPRLQHFGEDAVATRVLARAYAIRGDYKKADELFNRLVNSGKAEAQDYNAIAWDSLFEGSLGKDAFDAVDRGNMLTKQNSGPILHTAASMYAEAGKTKEARATILRRMEIEGHDEPDDDEWYVFGRILEQYGLNDAALSAYRKMKKPEHEWMEPLSSYELAQRRLVVLKASGAGGGPHQN
jgi:tetratricopeptide (TPR) repeat protein